MIPMSCPSCGRRGNVPLDRLNTRMHCKKCDAVFHLDSTGKPALGEPAAAKGSKAAKGGRAKDEPLDPIGIVAEKLSHTPKPIWMTLLVLGGGYLLWTVFQFLRPGPATAEQSMAVLIQTATDAFLEKDVPKLKAMATSDTEEDAAKIIEDFRPLVGDGGSTKDGVMVAAGEPRDGETEDQKAVEVSLLATSGPSFNLQWVWIRLKGRWLIDGRNSFDLNKVEADRNKAKAAEKAKAGTGKAAAKK